MSSLPHQIKQFLLLLERYILKFDSKRFRQGPGASCFLWSHTHTHNGKQCECWSKVLAGHRRPDHSIMVAKPRARALALKPKLWKGQNMAGIPSALTNALNASTWPESFNIHAVKSNEMPGRFAASNSVNSSKILSCCSDHASLPRAPFLTIHCPFLKAKNFWRILFTRKYLTYLSGSRSPMTVGWSEAD